MPQRKPARLRTKLKAAARLWSDWKDFPVTAALREQNPHLKHCERIMANSRFEVQLFNVRSEIGGVVQANIFRHGNLQKITWEDLQRVKNEIFGDKATAVEVYPPPADSWSVTQEIRVLWILPVGYEIPFGLHLSTSFGRTP